MKCKVHGLENCCEPECVAARRLWVAGRHPLIAKRGEEVPPALIPQCQALAMLLEMEEEARQRLAQIEADIAILRD